MCWDTLSLVVSASAPPPVTPAVQRATASDSYVGCVLDEKPRALCWTTAATAGIGAAHARLRRPLHRLLSRPHVDIVSIGFRASQHDTRGHE